MALITTNFKEIGTKDVGTATKTPVHEVIPITGSVISGTYSDNNIKKYALHGMFQSVYDYPYLSSSANHIFDITAGVWSGGTYGSSVVTASTNKQNIYSQMAQLMMGYNESGSIRPIDYTGNVISTTAANKFQSAIFVPFSRLLIKDEIQKETFSIVLGTGSYADPFAGTVTLSDLGAVTSYKNNSPAGEYGLLYTGSTVATKGDSVGLVFYQAGVAVLELTSSTISGIMPTDTLFISSSLVQYSYSGSVNSGTLDEIGDAFRHRVQNISFINTTELNSTNYFCRIHHDEFNYSSNPTYLSSSQIIVKDSVGTNPPYSYVTTVGLYSSDNVLLATAKLSEPIRITPQNEFTLRVRLDY